MKNTNKKGIINNILRKAITIVTFMSLVIGIMYVRPVEAKTSIKINKKSITLNVGEKCTLKISGTASNVKWSSNDKKIATVSSNGTVTAKKEGHCKITAKVNGKKIKCKVKVEAKGNSSGKNSGKKEKEVITKVTKCTSDEDYFSTVSNLINKYDDEKIKSGTMGVGEMHTNRIVVGGKPNLTGVNADAVVISPFGEYVIQFSDPESAQAFLKAQANNSNVEYAEEDKYIAVDFVDYYDTLGVGSWGTSYVEAEILAKYLRDNDLQDEIIIAVIDTGVDFSHPFLSGRIVGKGFDMIDSDDDAIDTINGHGTHVSGTIVDCTQGLPVKILPIRVLSYVGSGSSLTVAMGIRTAQNEGVEVINLSLGGERCSIMDAAIHSAVDAGITVVVAAGNESSDTSDLSPAHNEDCIVVSAIDQNSKKAYFSNYGRSVDIAAPGVGIRSCIPNGKYASWGGTSMATPHVAAAAAMVKMLNYAYGPEEIESILKKAALDLGTPGRDDVYGAGALKLADIVPAEISSISIASEPAKKEYFKNDRLSPDGLSINVNYSNGKSEKIETGFSCYPMELKNVGTETIFVSYMGYTTSFNVNVRTDEAIDISILQNPTKIEYFDGEILDTTGMILEAKYSSGEVKQITSGFTCTPTYLSISDVNSKDYQERRRIVVQYENMSTDFEVFVKAIVATDLSVEANKTKYTVGESISNSDLKVKVLFSDGRSEYVSGFSVYPAVLTSKGNQTITVSYAGLSKDYDVYVDEISISHIVIETLPDKRTYKVGETLDTTGISIITVFADGSKQKYTSGFTCTPMKLEKEGVQRITVLYGVYAAVFEVTVGGAETDWIPANEAPAGATIIDRKWEYDLVEKTESSDSNLSGWTLIGSDWKNVGSNTQKYSTEFPGTFDTDHEIYRTLAKSPVAGYVSDTKKREVNNRFYGYCYFHYMYNVAYHATTERAISDRYGMYDAYGNQGKGFGYWYFSAFLSTVDAPYLDNYYCCSRNQRSYDCRNIMPDKSSLGTGTPRYFRFNVYESVYTDYEKVFKFERTTHKESKTEVQPSESIRNVKEYVKYTM